MNPNGKSNSSVLSHHIGFLPIHHASPMAPSSGHLMMRFPRCNRLLNGRSNSNRDNFLRTRIGGTSLFVGLGARATSDKLDGYINQLGSCHPMDVCFWGHNRNIKYGYSDLTINQINNQAATIATLMKMGNRAPINPIPNKTDAHGNQTEFYTESDLKKLLETLPAKFENQRLWFTIPALKQSVENNDFDFVVSRGSWDTLCLLYTSPSPRDS